MNRVSIFLLLFFFIHTQSSKLNKNAKVALYKDQDADIDILGTYEIEGKPAIVTFEYGLSKVFIIGTHSEFEEDSDRDGFPPNDELYDRGSDWELMRRATEWCLKE